MEPTKKDLDMVYITDREKILINKSLRKLLVQTLILYTGKMSFHNLSRHQKLNNLMK